MTKRILIVDDDDNIKDVIAFALEEAGMNVTEAKDGKEALALFRASEPDLIVLDVMMPEMDGLELCRRLREISQVPILFLSSRSEEIDRVLGLELGGDDYLTKPFSTRELVARVKAILRRTQEPLHSKRDSAILTQGELSMNLESHRAFWGEQEIALTATEFSLLRVFLRSPDRVFERDSLMTQAYSEEIVISDRTIDSHIRRIRSKFADVGADEVIETLYGVGYRLGTCQ